MKKLSILGFFAVTTMAAQLFAADPVMKHTADGKNMAVADDSTVWVIDADGNKTAAADGKYNLADGTVMEVTEGKTTMTAAPAATK